ncbi:MAG: hypothetical protein ABSA30_13970 [Candidatus Aminicenantales bacterium]
MAKCARCLQRKAKRSCPALGRDLCPQCCGELRDREAACPLHCLHRERHKSYQDRRTAEKPDRPAAPPERAGEDVLRDERLSWLALHAEAPLVEIARAHPDFRDADAISALEYARNKAVRGGGLIVIPGQERVPGRDAGEAVRRSMDACRYERSVLLAGDPEGYTGGETIRVLDSLIPIARAFASQAPGGRTYLERLAAQFASLDGGKEKTRILAPR